jgi:hypothetical protein
MLSIPTHADATALPHYRTPMLPYGLLHVASDGVASTCGGADAESSSAMNSASIALVPCEKPSTSLVALPNLPHHCSNTYLSPSERSYSYRRSLRDWQMSVTVAAERK